MATIAELATKHDLKELELVLMNLNRHHPARTYKIAF